jgi:predicted secreted protein
MQNHTWVLARMRVKEILVHSKVINIINDDGNNWGSVHLPISDLATNKVGRRMRSKTKLWRISQREGCRLIVFQIFSSMKERKKNVICVWLGSEIRSTLINCLQASLIKDKSFRAKLELDHEYSIF